MKKLFTGILIVLVCIMVTACGSESLNINDIIDKAGESIEDATDNVDGIINNATGSDSEDNTAEDFKLYSDDTKIVYNFAGVYLLVYYHDGVNITGEEYYYNYGNSEAAALGVAALKSQLQTTDNVESITQNGKYIVVKFSEEEYKDLTLEEVKATYSYLEMIEPED